MRFILKHINTWKLKKWQSRFLYFIIRTFFKGGKIQKGDTIRCWGIGYPHWKGETFECTMIFENNTIGIKSAVRVGVIDFKKIK